MTRDEALHRLHGTWSFELRDGRVPLRDLDLLRAVRAERRSPVDDERARPPGARGPAAHLVPG
jgi:hypothetical protein